MYLYDILNICTNEWKGMIYTNIEMYQTFLFHHEDILTSNTQGGGLSRVNNEDNVRATSVNVKKFARS